MVHELLADRASADGLPTGLTLPRSGAGAEAAVNNEGASGARGLAPRPVQSAAPFCQWGHAHDGPSQCVEGHGLPRVEAHRVGLPDWASR